MKTTTDLEKQALKFAADFLVIEYTACCDVYCVKEISCLECLYEKLLKGYEETK